MWKQRCTFQPLIKAEQWMGLGLCKVHSSTRRFPAWDMRRDQHLAALDSLINPRWWMWWEFPARKKNCEFGMTYWNAMTIMEHHGPSWNLVLNWPVGGLCPANRARAWRRIGDLAATFREKPKGSSHFSSFISFIQSFLVDSWYYHIVPIFPSWSCW